MGKRAVQLGGEDEARIDVVGDPRPELCQFGLDVSVKRSVDFDRIEAAGNQFQRMPLPALHSGRVEDALPVLVGPSGRAHADVTRLGHPFILSRYAPARVWN